MRRIEEKRSLDQLSHPAIIGKIVIGTFMPINSIIDLINQSSVISSDLFATAAIRSIAFDQDGADDRPRIYYRCVRHSMLKQVITG